MNEIVKGNPYQTLINFNGLYESPKDPNGKYQGPLVAYAGTYIDDNGEKKNYVGFAYFNMAKVEEDYYSRLFFADILANKIYDIGKPTTLIGAPMGGIIFATTTADYLACRVAFFEKKVTEVANPSAGTKEQSDLIFNRHDINEGDEVVLFEDLCNNFSTTDKMIDIITSKGGKVTAIACVFNRSQYTEWKGIPVISVIHSETKEYKQTDSEVEELIKSGNIVWKPKAEWRRLKAAMETGNQI